MARLSIQLLGTFRATLDGKPVTAFESDKARALLAYLAVESDRAHSRQKLAGLLWPERSERAARQNLSQALSNLRSATGDRSASPPFLIITPQSLRFNPASDHTLDTRAFAQLLDDCEDHDHDALASCDLCVEGLSEALALCRGPFLEGFSLAGSAPFEEWALLEGERLRRLEIQALRSAADCLTQRGDRAHAIEFLERWTHVEPWDEGAHRELMGVLSLSGRRSAALRQYQECEHVLREELGLAPSERTTELYEAIRAQQPERAEAAPSRLGPKHNLPPQAIPFVGRTEMLADIEACVTDPECRLLTLVGPGGSGKTRLALEAVSGLVDAYQHGVFLVSLAGVAAAEGVAPAVARAAGFAFHPEGNPEEQLVGHLRNRQMLLVLDNFEHLLVRAGDQIGEAAALTSTLLDGAPNVKLLVTSRAALRVRHEHLFPVTGMAYPDLNGARGRPTDPETATAFSAVRLFEQSARRVAPHFRLEAENVADVIRICDAVNGMPLGLLLAAAWVHILPPREIADQIAAGLDLLDADLRDVPRRHRSMRAVFDHSWNLLSETEQAVMQALSVFRGGFTWPAARAVTGAALRELRTLVDRSLVQPADEGERYQLHELLRQYASEKLTWASADRKTIRDRHAAFFAASLETWSEDLKGHRQRGAIQEVDADYGNCLAAWEWASAQLDMETLGQAVEGLGLYCERRGRHREARTMFCATEQRLRTAGIDETGRAEAVVPLLMMMLRFRAWALWLMGRADDAYTLVAEGLELAERPEYAHLDTRSAQAALLWVHGSMGLRTGRDEPRQALQRAVALARAANDRWRLAHALILLGAFTSLAGDEKLGHDMLEESAAIRRKLGDERGLADSYRNTGWSLTLSNQAERGEQLIHQSLQMCRELGDPVMTADSLLAVSLVCATTGRFAEAEAQLRERLAINDELGLRDFQGRNYLAKMVCAQGRYEEARAILDEAFEMVRETGILYGTALCTADLGRLAIVDGDYEEAWRLFHESATAYAGMGQRANVDHAHVMFAYAARGMGNHTEARRLIAEGLHVAASDWDFLGLVDTVPAAALLLLDQGETLRAVEVFEMASTLPFVGNDAWAHDVVGKPIEEAAESLHPEAVAAALERGRKRDVLATCRELAEEFEA